MDLRIAFTNDVKAYIARHPDQFDPKKYGAVAVERVKQYVLERMKVLKG